MSEIVNAKIVSTSLGFEDHGIMSFMITLDCGNFHQGFGGWALDEYIKNKDKRVGNAWGMEAVMRVLRALDVDSWEKLKGMYVRAKIEGGRIVSIGHIVNNTWWEKP
jgi:hypothetical protein